MKPPQFRTRRSRSRPTIYSAYEKWNEQVNQYFLREEDAGKALYLDPQPELYAHLEERFGLEPGTGQERLLEVVRGVVHQPGSGRELFATLAREVHLWRRDARGRSARENYEERAFPPPVAAVLVATVIAAQQMQESDLRGKYVSSTNYYNHLVDVFGLRHEARDKLSKDFRVTEEFWEAFNWWLEDMDGWFGLPTAYANHHRFVGLPVSQAIVRVADRQAFKRLFTQYALMPGALLSPAEMESLLDEWTSTHNSGASKELIQKWKQDADLRGRIVETAITELTSWDGEVDRSERTSGAALGGTVSSSTADSMWVPLALVPRGRKEDTESADLGLAFRRADGHQTWRIVHSSGEDVLRPRELSTTHAYAAGYEIGVGSEQLLNNEIHLKGPEGRSMKRVPRRIVMLVHDESAGAYVETRRAVPGTRHRILVSPDATQDMVDELRTLLKLTSFAGNRDMIIDGIHPDWLVIDGFVPGAVADPGDFTSNEVASLIAPVQTQFTLQGGLRLPGRLKKWHGDALPSILVTTDSSVKASYEIRLSTVSNGEDVSVLASGIAGATVVDFPDDLDNGDYRVALYKTVARGKNTTTTEPLQTETVRLRTGAEQDYEGLRRHSGAAHDQRPLTAAAALSGIAQKDITVLGVDVLAEEGGIVSTGPLDDIEWRSQHHPQQTSRTSLVLPSPSPDSCLVTGSHVFVFPTFINGRAPGPWQTGTCRQCGAVRRTPTRSKDAMKPEHRHEYDMRRGRAESAVRDKAAGRTATADAESLPALRTNNIAAGIVVDSFVHAYSGDQASLQTLVTSSGAGTGDQPFLLRDLSALGVLETTRDAHFRRDRWEVAPPAVLTLANGKVALGGSWPLHRLDDIHNVVNDVGARFHSAHSLAELPTITGTSVGELANYTDLDGIANAEDAWWLIGGQLPNLSQIGDELARRNMQLETGPFQMFRRELLAWVDVADWNAPGLYRRDRGYHRRDYWFRTDVDVDNGTAAAVDVELGKHLLAQANGQTLLSFDSDAQLLTVPLGARLPELYERAAVLCSGRLPGSSPQEFRHTYRDVPDELAAGLSARMSS